MKAKGHDVIGLARRPENEDVISSLGGEPRREDVFNVDSLVRAVGNSDIVIRAATAIPPGFRWRKKDWAVNDKIRCEGTRALVECAKRIHVKMYLQESVVWVAQPSDGSSFDEGSPVTSRLWLGSAADAESIASIAITQLTTNVLFHMGVKAL